MNEQQQNETQSHKDGPPWENIRVFSSFGEADACRKALLQEPSKQVKVKMQVNSQGENVFVVKQRFMFSILIFLVLIKIALFKWMFKHWMKAIIIGLCWLKL
jgi:hypothetical protein